MNWKISILFLVLLFCRPDLGMSQDNQEPSFNPHAKGALFFYWGYNRSAYTMSNIRFEGPGYRFELEDVIARDRQTPFDADIYLHSTKFTIPQYNISIGYHLKDGLSLSFNADHMKYVMVANQKSKIIGFINVDNSRYSNSYDGELITLSPDFLEFEHSDGLNYANLELTRFCEVRASQNGKLILGCFGGVASGLMIPKSNVKFLGEGSDKFHIAGFGMSTDVGLSLTLWKCLGFQYKVKGGYINMPDILINTRAMPDRAKQEFWFIEHSISIGAVVPINVNKQR